MKISSTWNYKSIAGKIMMGLVLATMIGSMEVAPALAKDDHKHMGKHDNGRNEHRGRGYEHGRHARGRQGYRPYGYSEPVYVAPPVYYEPPPPPGISIFFPPIHIR